MLCASGFEFSEKLRLALMEREAAQRSLAVAAVPGFSRARRLEEALERYEKRLSDFMRHKEICALCREI
jgi:hypothetical protein